jgi:hypothetical protein
MRNRGQKFRQWNSGALNPFRHAAILRAGVQVDVQVQLSDAVTLIFVGIYTNSGYRVFEHCYGTLHKTNQAAVDWGMCMAEQTITIQASHPG